MVRIGITVDADVTAISFFGDKTIGAGAKGAHDIVESISADLEDDFVEGLGVAGHD